MHSIVAAPSLHYYSPAGRPVVPNFVWAASSTYVRARCRKRSGISARLVLFSALIISSTLQLSARKVIIFSLKVCLLNIREVRGGEVLGPMGREFLGWRDWVGRVGGWW